MSIEEALKLPEVLESLYLTPSEMDSLIINGSIVKSDVDSLEVIRQSINFNKNYTTIYFEFLSGQRVFSSRKLRLFNHKDGDQMLLLVQITSAARISEVQKIEMYRIGHNEAQLYETNVIEGVADKKFFLRNEIPQEYYNRLYYDMSVSIDFDSDSSKIKVYNSYPYEEEIFLENTLAFDFIWNGESFVIQELPKEIENNVP